MHTYVHTIRGGHMNPTPTGATTSTSPPLMPFQPRPNHRLSHRLTNRPLRVYFGILVSDFLVMVFDFCDFRHWFRFYWLWSSPSCSFWWFISPCYIQILIFGVRFWWFLWFFVPVILRLLEGLQGVEVGTVAGLVSMVVVGQWLGVGPTQRWVLRWEGGRGVEVEEVEILVAVV